MVDKIRLDISYIKNSYLENPRLRLYQGIQVDGYHIVAMTNEMANEFIVFSRSDGKEKYLDKVICGNCLNNFIVKDTVCTCYEKIIGYKNYILIIADEMFKDTEEVIRKIKKELKSKNRARIRKKLEASADGYYAQNDIKALFSIQNGLCYYCMEAVSNKGTGKFSVDHIIPLSFGGSNWATNLALSCKKCNLMKSWKSERWFLKKIRRDKTADWCASHKAFISEIKRRKRMSFTAVPQFSK